MTDASDPPVPGDLPEPDLPEPEPDLPEPGAPPPEPPPEVPVAPALVPVPSLVDPRTLYPRPPWPEQAQPAPGATAAMDPRPDHGETSYVGAGRLQGRRALVTGGDSGIGRAVAIAFWREGAAVTIAYLPAEEADAQEVAALAAEEGAELHLIPGDLLERETAEGLPGRAAALMGGLDLLVCNASMQMTTDTIDDVSFRQFDEVLRVNVLSTFLSCRAALPLLPPGGSIIVTASIQAFAPAAGLPDYAASKAAQVAFVESLSKQAIRGGVRVNAVAPGPIWTPLQPSCGKPMDMLTGHGADTTIGRAGQPAECAGAYVFLASREASYITGLTLGVTGGAPVH
ncbi:SDR family oxidoreductase [Frigidibacter oleivorans]|uniref:SDR family oxidoreductase n=1 Tax=Frigidibacter oleivorans TaxID=2487129 RepID=UPI000F8DE951|nr:SDR family oxidoreductase [Frigidibacter oleivorans]